MEYIVGKPKIKSALATALSHGALGLFLILEGVYGPYEHIEIAGWLIVLIAFFVYSSS